MRCRVDVIEMKRDLAVKRRRRRLDDVSRFHSENDWMVRQRTSRIWEDFWSEYRSAGRCDCDKCRAAQVFDKLEGLI